MSSTTPLSRIEDRSILTRRIDTYKKVFSTKVASNYTFWWYNHSEWSSRLPCPPQIQLESRRTGAVLTRRMDTYKDVVLTKVALNHTNWWYNHSEGSSRLTCPPQIQPGSRRMGESWRPFWLVLSSIGMNWSNICQDNIFVIVHSPSQDCTRPPAP